MWFNRHKNLAMAVLTGVVAVVLMAGAVWPIYQNANAVLGKIRVKSSELEALTNKVTLLSKLDPAVLQERVTTLDMALPPRKDVLLYLTSIDGLSNDLQLNFGGVSLAPGELSEATSSAGTKKSVSSAGVQSLETEIKILGGEDNVYSFLRTVEEVLPLMQIKGVKVTVLGDNEYSLALTMGMLWAEPATADVKSKITLFGDEEEKYFAQLAGYRRYDQTETETGGTIGKQDLFSTSIPQQ